MRKNHLQNPTDASPPCVLQLCSPLLSTNLKVLVTLSGLALLAAVPLGLIPRPHLGAICCLFLLQTPNAPHRSSTERRFQRTPRREEPHLGEHHVGA